MCIKGLLHVNGYIKSFLHINSCHPHNSHEERSRLGAVTCPVSPDVTQIEMAGAESLMRKSLTGSLLLSGGFLICPVSSTR